MFFLTLSPFLRFVTQYNPGKLVKAIEAIASFKQNNPGEKGFNSDSQENYSVLKGKDSKCLKTRQSFELCSAFLVLHALDREIS